MCLHVDARLEVSMCVCVCERECVLIISIINEWDWACICEGCDLMRNKDEKSIDELLAQWCKEGWMHLIESKSMEAWVFVRSRQKKNDDK